MRVIEFNQRLSSIFVQLISYLYRRPRCLAPKRLTSYDHIEQREVSDDLPEQDIEESADMNLTALLKNLFGTGLRDYSSSGRKDNIADRILCLYHGENIVAKTALTSFFREFGSLVTSEDLELDDGTLITLTKYEFSELNLTTWKLYDDFFLVIICRERYQIAMTA